jgi:hypothetical protein
VASSGSGSAAPSPTSKLARGSVTWARAYATNASEGSIPTTDAGAAWARIVSVTAPVPHPTSTHRAPVGMSKRSMNASRPAGFQRPT